MRDAAPCRIMPRSTHSAAAKRLCDLLIQARLNADLTQVDLAEKLRRPQSFVSKYETGERRLDVIEFIEVTDAIGADPARIIRLIRR